MLKKLKKKLKNLNNLVPVKIRTISFSLALFMLWRWLWTDTYFSIYIREIVWNTRWVTAIWTILAITKLFFVIPIGRMNDRVNVKYILLIWKIMYAICWLLFFFAWIFHSWVWLVLAAILNWIANATTFTTYRSYYAKKSTKSDHTQVFGVYFSATYITEVIWSLIAAVLVNYLELPYMYFFVVIFALVSILQDQKIKTVLSKHYNKTWKRFYNRVQKESKVEHEIDEWRDSKKSFFGKKWFFRAFVKECLSSKSRKEIWLILRKYDNKLYIALWSHMLTNFLNYMSFLFIPIIAVENNLSLSQIAIVFAAMKLPYIINVFIWKFWDRYSKKLLISIILVLMSFLYVGLWFSDNFYTILTLTFLISLWIAMLNPLTSALVISYTKPKDMWAMTWVKDFASRLWDIIWSLWFWTLTAIIWLSKWFITIWICTFWLWAYLMIKKLVSYHRENNEREKTDKGEVYEIPAPVIDSINSINLQ